MANFSEAVKIVIAQEGGLSDHPNDPGGVTKYGISWFFIRTLKDEPYCHWTIEDIVNMTVKDAEKIYHRYFWEPRGYELISNQRIATMLFSLGVLTHPKAPVMKFQTALNEVDCHGIKLLREDGVIGNQTVKRLEDSVYNETINNVIMIFKYYMWVHFLDKTNKTPKKEVFLRGWLNRLKEL